MKTPKWKQQRLWSKNFGRWMECLVNGTTVIPFPDGYPTDHALSVINTGHYSYLTTPRRNFRISHTKMRTKKTSTKG